MNKLGVASIVVISSLCLALIIYIAINSLHSTQTQTESLAIDETTFIEQPETDGDIYEPSNTHNTFKCQYNKKIYIDFIYNPHYYYELTVLKFMLGEILGKNKNLHFTYDYDNLPNSTLITVGHEHSMINTNERTIMLIKPKLLKDILYTENLFQQIYMFLFTNLRICDHVNVPEYDRLINLARYRSIFKEMPANIDAVTPNSCRSELLDVYEGRVCVSPDFSYINSLNFKFSETHQYWITLLNQTSTFMNILLANVLQFTPTKTNCYSIKLRPEPYIRQVLLFPHKAAKTICLDEFKNFPLVDSKNAIISDVILYKHRILHALGLSHRYSRASVMNSYEKPWQQPNVFYILPEDYKSLADCYLSSSPHRNANSNYVQFNPKPNWLLINEFQFNFELFIQKYTQN